MNSRIIIDITERCPVAEGHAFGPCGPYERLVGRVRYAVDPLAAAQRGVTDIDSAHRNAQGQVEFSTDLYILKPAGLEKGNGRLLFDFMNRGNKRAVQMFNDAPASNDPRTLTDLGTGFLMRRGYTVVWAAWQGDILPGNRRMLLDVPVASEDGCPIVEPVRSEFIAERPGELCYPLSGNVAVRSYPAATRDTRQCTFTRRQYAWSERLPIGPDEWRFARLESGVSNPAGLPFDYAIVPCDSHVFLPAGFSPGWIYELIYPARDPLVLGLGYVAVRDLISFLKYGDDDGAGAPNPLRQGDAGIEKAYCFGRSQSGRAIRDYIYQGFNADADGRRVFDGAWSHVAGAGRICLNHRWAHPLQMPSFQHENHDHYSDRFPFSYATTTDHLTGASGALLRRPETDPYVFHTQTSTEYWQRHGSLVHTDTQGNDLLQPENVRVYSWASAQHWNDPICDQLDRGIGTYYKNDLIATAPLFRALLDHLDHWATDGTPPPASRAPSRAEGALVTYDEWRTEFPDHPGVVLPIEPNPLPVWDYGPDADSGHITIDPPRESAGGERYVILVPAVDGDGNEIAGIRMPLVDVPLGTYLGWNIRRRGQSPGAMTLFYGGYIPFARTQAERLATQDPRPSIEERYAGEEEFLKAIAGAAERLAKEGFLLLGEDLGAILKAASRAWQLAG